MFITIDPISDHLWKNHPTYNKAKANEDVGLDIPMIKPVVVPANAISFKIKLGFKARPTHGYMLVPRSSISKTSIRLANSIGIIDRTYLGNIIVALIKIDETAPDLVLPLRMVQMIPTPIVHFELEEVESFDVNETERGEGGFGSTNK